MNPIWKDYIVDLGRTVPTRFSILVELPEGADDPGVTYNEAIYEGLAVLRPGEDTVRVKINDICASFLANRFDFLRPFYLPSMAFPVRFSVQYYNGSAWVTVEDQIQFTDDWSYDPTYVIPSNGCVCAPINGRLDRRQFFLATLYGKTSLPISRVRPNGTASSATLQPYTAEVTDDFLAAIRMTGTGTVRQDLYGYSAFVGINAGAEHYDIVDPCGQRYVLYYVNAYGGWDSFLVEARVDRTDTLTRHTAGKVYDNRLVSNRGMVNYVNEISPAFTFHTGWLTDAQAARVPHLLNATTVFVHDLESGTIRPAVLTNTATEYKTFRNNGNRFVDYTVEVAIAQTFIRR